MSVLVFVYGTLRKGDFRYGAGNFIRTVALEAYLQDFDMLDLGGFPGIVPNGRCKIRGEVHEYENLEILDKIEGYQEDSPDHGLYTRIKVRVATPKEKIENCWVYVFNLGDRTAPVIESGDWFKHKNLYGETQGLET